MKTKLKITEAAPQIDSKHRAALRTMRTEWDSLRALRSGEPNPRRVRFLAALGLPASLAASDGAEVEIEFRALLQRVANITLPSL